MASRSLGTLTLDLIAKIGGFVAGMTQAERVANKKLSDIEKRAYAFGRAMGGAIKVGLAATATAATAAVAVLGKTIDSMDEMSKAAQKVGDSTENFSRLVYAGSLADVSMEQLSTTLGKLTKSQAASLKSTSEQAKLFKALGISATDAEGNLRKSSDVLLDFADRFKALKGSPEVVAAGFNLFGRSFQDLIPLLKDGSEGIREAMQESDALGKTLSTSAGQEAEQFNDNLTRLKTAVEGLAQQVASDLLPDLVQLTDDFVDATKAGNSSTSVAHDIANGFRAVGEVIGFVGDLLGTFGSRVEGLTESMVGLYQVASGLTSLDWTRIRAGAESIKEGGLEFFSGDRKRQASGPDFSNVISGSHTFSLAAQVKQIKEARAQAEALRKALGDPDPKKKTARAKKSGKSEEQKEAEQLEQAYKSANERLKEQVTLFGQDGEAAQLRYELENGALAKLDPLKKAELVQLAEKLDTMRDELELQKKIDEEHDTRQKQAQDVLDSINQERDSLGLSADQWELYNNIKRAGANASDENIAAITAETKALQDQRKALEPQIALMDEFRSGLEDAVVGVIDGSKSIKDAFKDLFDDLAAQITRWIAKRLIEQAFGAQGTVGQGSGGWGQIIGNVLGAFFGGGGGRAAGGAVMPWQSYRVNENGPELLSMGNRDYLMMGNRAGRVISQPSAMGASYGDTNIYVQGSATRETIKQIDRANGRRARRELGRTGG